MPPIDPAASRANCHGSKIYLPHSGKQLRLAFLSLIFGLLGLLPLKAIWDWHNGGRAPDPRMFLAVLCLIGLPVSVLCFLNALRGLPRLTIAARGLSLRTSLRKRSAEWADLEPFTLKTVYAGRFRKPVQVATANVVGPVPDWSRRRLKTISIPDHFEVPIATILDDLNGARTRALGTTVLAPASPTAVYELPVGLEDFKFPWLTFAILAGLIMVFVLENIFAVTPAVRSNPSIPTLVAFGALSRTAVLAHGEWYRLFTAPLLHANFAHIAGNGVALLLGGWLLERLIGRLWFFAIFAVSALGGSLLSLVVGSPTMVSVGASGALMGLFAAQLVTSLHLPSGSVDRVRAQVNASRILIPSLLPIFSPSNVHIDYGAHFGGALSGAALALLLIKVWPKTERLPQLPQVAIAISIIGAGLFFVSGSMVMANYPHVYRPPGAGVQPADVLKDHGPKRPACDFEWSKQDKTTTSYEEFLAKCMSSGANIGNAAARNNPSPTYAQQISEALQRHKKYPADAVQQRVEGTAIVSFTINSDGRVAEMHIARSSGFSVLDQAALDTVDQSQPFPLFPKANLQKKLTLSVPISFQLSPKKVERED
jgi:TonB family protein